MTDYETIKDEERDTQPLYSRMDVDRNAVYLKTYTLTAINEDTGKEEPIPGATSVTMNEPAVFANAIVAIIMTSKVQTTVEGLTDRGNRTVEEFLDAWGYLAERRLKKRRVRSLLGWLANHVCVRGPIGVRDTIDEMGRPFYRPIDMRYCPYSLDEEGHGWVAPLSYRSGQKIIDEYGKIEGVKLDQVDKRAKELEVYDAWDDEENTVFVSGVPILTRPHPYKRPPFAIEFPEAGFMLQDKGYLAHWAESIFVLDRGLYKSWNELMSIQQSMAVKSLHPAYVQEVEPGGSVDNSDGSHGEYPDKPRTLTPYPKGELPAPLQTKEINKAFELARMDINQALQRGGVNNIDLGNVNQATSAIWITEQSEIRNKILAPRLDAIAGIKVQLAELDITNYKLLGKTNELGRPGRMKSYAPAALPDPEDITIEYRYMSRNTKQEIANLSMAASAKGLYSLEDIHRNILLTDDVEGALDRLHAEQAEQADPVIFYFRQSRRLIALADKAKSAEDEEKEESYRVEAILMKDRMTEEIKRRKIAEAQPQNPMGGTGQPPKFEQGKGAALNALPSMFGRGAVVPQGAAANA